MKTRYADISGFHEDVRIKTIGQHASTKIVGVALEKDQPDKIKRYIERITQKFPNVRHIDTVDGLTATTVLVRFGPATTH